MFSQHLQLVDAHRRVDEPDVAVLRPSWSIQGDPMPTAKGVPSSCCKTRSAGPPSPVTLPPPWRCFCPALLDCQTGDLRLQCAGTGSNLGTCTACIYMFTLIQTLLTPSLGSLCVHSQLLETHRWSRTPAPGAAATTRCSTCSVCCRYPWSTAGGRGRRRCLG